MASKRRGSAASASKKGRKARSVVSSGSVQRDELADAAKQAVADRKENAANVRKNKAYLELKRDLDQRMRARAKQETEGEKRTEVFYVDRDRAAAVTIGSKDIKNDLKGKRRRDFNKQQNEEGDEDECDKETYLAQGKFELKHGDARRALFCLNKAADSAVKNLALFVLRSEANCILGNYEAADADADVVLGDDPLSVPGLLAKAETKYHQGAFEHALKFFYRAQNERPDYQRTRLGINKAKWAIENSLSITNGFTFDEMKDVIAAIIAEEEEKERELKLKQEMELLAEATEAAAAAINAVSNVEETLEESADEILDPDKPKTSKKESIDNGVLTSVDLHKVMGVSKANTLVNEKLLATMRSRVQTAKETLTVTKKKEQKLCNAAEVRMANKQLLGKLHQDRMYLQSLLENPLLTKKYSGSEQLNIVPKKILQCANEGLKYLDDRKDFWQQQKPVYARKNELFAHQKTKQKKMATHE